MHMLEDDLDEDGSTDDHYGTREFYPRTTERAFVGSVGVAAVDDAVDTSAVDADLAGSYGSAAEMAMPVDIARGARGTIGALTGLGDLVDE